ncbi:MAG TPA: DNA-3-methyladenine glycosylase [Bacteroidota bacterium]
MRKSPPFSPSTRPGLRPSFYLRPTLVVARDLLGKYLVRSIGREVLAGRIVEVEAYRGKRDPASHTYRGKTKRNEVMFLEGGHLYVYFTYGMHFCANVVTGPKGIGEAVLLRGIEPVAGLELMMKNRAFDKKRKDVWNLTNGPAKLCEAFGIARADNGSDLLNSRITIVGARRSLKEEVVSSSRIGIRVGTEHRWRFYLHGNPWVSHHRK